VKSRVDALVKYAGGHDPGPLALPDETTTQDQPPVAGDQPPPVTHGPWGDVPPAPSNNPPPLPGVGPAQGPFGPLQGPWGRHR
ncbi:MAG: peptidase M48 Ste24p, partial [Rhizobium sp.]|nr:peptidase M48 Ste24p [Rhizobium sp.]